MKTLAIIGANGMLGSDLVRFLGDNFSVTPITKENYELHKGKSFDIVVNANGNSKRFWANQNPVDDFYVSTVSVYKSIFDFPCGVYVFISSPDVYEDHQNPTNTTEEEIINPQNLKPYGFNKYLGELIVKKNRENFLILRSSLILGTKLKKGPFYDILNNQPLHITLDTKLQIITTEAMAQIIETLLEKNNVNNVLNIGGIGVFDFADIKHYINKSPEILSDAETQEYEMNVEKLKKLYPNLKTSPEYVQEFLKKYFPS